MKSRGQRLIEILQPNSEKEKETEFEFKSKKEEVADFTIKLEENPKNRLRIQKSKGRIYLSFLLVYIKSRFCFTPSVLTKFVV